ncbi:MAG: hypothetical protein ACRESZ_09850 [Methylococcales bacterium]
MSNTFRHFGAGDSGNPSKSGGPVRCGKSASSRLQAPEGSVVSFGCGPSVHRHPVVEVQRFRVRAGERGFPGLSQEAHFNLLIIMA